MKRPTLIMAKNWIIKLVVLFGSVSCIYSQDVTYHIDEELPNSTYIGNIGEQSNLFSAVGEADSSTFVYSFLTTGNPYAQYFRVEETTSKLHTNAVIDREKVCEFSDTCMLVVQVAAKSTLGSFFRILKVHIFIDDINDNSPEFNRSGLTQGISEAVLVGTSISIEGARDKDTSADFSLKSYELESNDLLSTDLPFSIQFVKHLDGSSVIKLFVIAPLDREIRDIYRLEIVAKDGDDPPRIGRLPVIIIVTDVNDNPPEFTEQNYNVAVNEETMIGSVVLDLVARDQDTNENGIVKYRLSRHQSTEIFKYFRIDEDTGELILQEPIVYSPGKFFRMIVEAYDNPVDGQSLSAQTLVTVTVENSGNNPPEININLISDSDESSDKDSAVVSEFANIGYVVAHLTVQDHDVGKQGVTNCIIESIDFNLQRMGVNEYTVVLAQKLDYERSRKQNVTVHCQDNGSPPLHASEVFTVYVKDENDHAPIFTKAFYTKNLSEDAPKGEYILEVSATDMDTPTNAQIHFEVAEKFKDIFFFENSARTPNSGYLRLNGTLDRETKSSYVFPIKAIDSGSPTKTGIATINLHITDVNDEKPMFTSPSEFYILENMPADSEVGKVTAIDRDLGMNSQIEYRLDPADMGIVPFVVFADGLIKTNQELDREELNHYEFNVIAMDKGRNALSSTGKVEVNVMDTNDQDPNIVFPRYPNNTIVIRPVISAWEIVTRVIAYDEDEVDTGNSRLRYAIEGRNDSRLFKINPNTGEVQVTKDLRERDLGKVYRLDILVSDFGKPAERSAISPLVIRVSLQNATLEHLSDKEDGLSNQNFLIAIIVGIVTVVLAIGILATICIIHKIDRQRKAEQKKTAKSDYEMETKFDGSITVFSLPSEDSLLNEKKKKEVSFSLEDDVFSDDDLIQKNGIALDHNHHRHFKPNLAYLAPSPKKVEDNHSETSGDTGTSDSGRGGSDEEIHTNMSQSPRDKMMDLSRSIPPMSHQEIIPFSFKKGIAVPYHSETQLKNNRHDLDIGRHDLDIGRHDLDIHRSGMTGMSTMAIHMHNNSLDRSQNKVVLLQTDSGIHSDTNSNEGDPVRDCMV